MCKILGVSSKHPVKINPLLEEFYSHCDTHPDGWGLATFHGKAVSLEKEPEKASKSTYLKHRMSRPITSATAFAHIRRATVGNMEYSNCHPFVWDDESGRTWTLMHNGTVLKNRDIAPYFAFQEGSSDSEGILMLIIDKINEETHRKGRALRGSERFRVIDNIVQELSYGNKINLLIYDGDQMYVHKNCEDTLYVCQQDDLAIFSTTPLKWGDFHPLSMNTLLAYKHGKQIRRGTTHENSFDMANYDMSMIYAAYAAL